MNFYNTAIILIQIYGATSFAFTQPKTSSRRRVAHSTRSQTELFYLKDETTMPVAFAPDQSVMGLQTDNGLSRLRDGVHEKVSYDDIQNLIDVSRPYYNLKDEHLVKDLMTGSTLGFAATVTPEMPLSYESGTMTAAEAGRHTAIAGSVAAALFNQEEMGNNGKHYYLALDAHLRQEPIMDSEIRESFDNIPSNKGDARVFAHATDVNKRDATAEVYLLTDDNALWHITVTYKIIPFKVFDRFFPLSVDPSLTGPWDETNSPNPYLKNIVTHITPQPLAHWKDSNVYQCKSHIAPATPSMCAGHFDSNPCFPVAFMCSHLFNIGAESVAELAGVNVPYTPRSEITTTNTKSRNSVTIQDLVLDAQTLCMAGTYGLNVDCTTQKQGSLYKTEIKATSDCEKKLDVATITVTYTVNEAC
jgi:hypothetical protein